MRRTKLEVALKKVGWWEGAHITSEEDGGEELERSRGMEAEGAAVRQVQSEWHSCTPPTHSGAAPAFHSSRVLPALYTACTNWHRESRNSI